MVVIKVQEQTTKYYGGRVYTIPKWNLKKKQEDEDEEKNDKLSYLAQDYEIGDDKTGLVIN